MMKNIKDKFALMLITLTLALPSVACGPVAVRETSQTTVALETSEQADPSLSGLADETVLPERMGLSEAVALVAERPDILLIDVRTEGEYKQGHIPGAMLLPLDRLETEIATVASDKDAPIILYCRSGNRSGQAARLLRGLGYRAVSDAGGILGYGGEIVQSSD